MFVYIFTHPGCNVFGWTFVFLEKITLLFVLFLLRKDNIVRPRVRMDPDKNAMEIDIKDQELVETLAQFESRDKTRDVEMVESSEVANASLPEEPSCTTRRTITVSSMTSSDATCSATTPRAERGQPKINTFFLGSAALKKKPFDPNACRKCKNPIKW